MDQAGSLESSHKVSARASPFFPVIATLVVITLAMIIRVASDPSFEGPPEVGSYLNPAFSLIDQDATPFTNASFDGKPRVILFGYTSCPDICPTSLAALAENITQLGVNASKLDFVFFTVDPKRDTSGRLKSYLAAFSPQLIGLTGKPATVSKALDDFHVFRAVRQNSGEGYSVDHTSTAYLISGDGRLQDVLKQEELGTTAALSKIKRLIAR